MFLNRNKNGYGWFSQVKTKEGESENISYINFSFKKGTEPFGDELNEYGSYEGELIFRDTTGAERKVFPIAKEWNGKKSVEFKLLEKTNENRDPYYSPQTDVKMDLSDGKIYTNEISSDDLPFDYEEPMRWK